MYTTALAENPGSIHLQESGILTIINIKVVRLYFKKKSGHAINQDIKVQSLTVRT